MSDTKKRLMARVPMRPTPQVAVSNGTGGGMNVAVTAFLMFAFGRYYGSQDLIPLDVLQILPYLVAVIGIPVHAVAEWWTRDRHVKAVTEPDPPDIGGPQ